MSQYELEFAKPVGPSTSKITVIGATTSSVHTDLTNEAITLDFVNGRLLSLIAEGDIWYRWSLLASGETVDETATSGVTRASWLPAGEHRVESPPLGCQGIVIKAPAACKVRIWASSRDPGAAYT